MTVPGVCNFYCRFIPGFTKVTKLLTEEGVKIEKQEEKYL